MKYSPNESKKIDFEADGNKYLRYPIKTHVFAKGDNYAKKISEYAKQAFLDLKPESEWYIVVSEKIVAISQGRSFFIKDIKPSKMAKFLSDHVTRTPHGIGLGSPWTMQIAIDEVGAPRILFAAFVAAITKPFGFKGLFYKIAGEQASAIDGPTQYSLYPSNVSAKLAPKNPQKAAEKIKELIKLQFAGRDKNFNNFGGVVIIDANDLGRKVLGNATEKPNSFFEKVMTDNPMGQTNEQTPVVFLV